MTHPATLPLRPYFHRVDALRGIGALAVAAFHFGGWPLHNEPLIGTASHRLIPAHPALMLFFVISGFVLRVSLAFGPERVGPAAFKFFVARLFRVLPIVILATACVAIVPWLQVHDGNRVKAATELSTGEWVQNALLLRIDVNATLWALQVEMLMMPAIFLIWLVERRRGMAAVHAIALVTTALVFVPFWAVWPPLSINVFAFVLGMLVPTTGRTLALAGGTTRAALLLTFASAVWFGSGLYFGLYSHLSALCEGIAAFVLLCIVVHRHDLKMTRWLDLAPLRALGETAGSMYVLHMLTLKPMLILSQMIIPAPAPAWCGTAVMVAWFAALAVIARMGYRAIEKPGIAAGRAVVKWYTAKPVVVQERNTLRIAA